MKLNVFHASTERIERFDFTYGVHFGGINSALEAALRHGSELVYVHKCILNPTLLASSVDLGSTVVWDGLQRELTIQGFCGARYINKYEPDVVPSYFIVKDVVEIVSCSVLSRGEADKFLEECFDSYVF